VRGKTGRVIGSLVATLTMMKGLPLAYSKDMQEDKEQVFDAADTIEIALAAMTGMMQDLEPVPERMAAVAGAGYSTATDLPTGSCGGSTSRSGGPPHHRPGGGGSRRAGLWARGTALGGLPGCRSPHRLDEVFEVLGVENSVRSRTSFGGTARNGWPSRLAWWKGSCESTGTPADAGRCLNREGCLCCAAESGSAGEAYELRT
jgi:argininosuccinate lyase